MVVLLASLLGGCFPWTAALLCQPGLFATVWRKRQTDSKLSRFVLFCLCWALAILILFGCLKTKLPTYILPAVTPLSVIAAIQLKLVRRWRKRLVLLILALLFTATAASVFVASGRLHGYLHDLIQSHALYLIAATIFSLIAVAFSIRQKIEYAVFALIAAALIATATVPHGMIAFYEDRQKGFDQLTFMVKNASANLAILIAEEPSAPYILHKRVPRLETPTDAKEYLATTAAPHWLLVPKECLQDLTWFSKAQLKGQYRKWLLYEVQ